MSACPGRPWNEIAPGAMSDAEERRLRNELGRIVARLHSVTGPAGFGYPGQALGPLSPTWRQAFTAMTDAVLADADTYRARLPRSTADIRALFAAASPVLDDVTRPALVHFDLWQGNLLVDGEPGARTIGGIIDGERMFWGDPVADFVSLALFADMEDDADFLAGYAQGAGRPVVFDASVRLRLALYRCYLYLIMLVETVPRRVPREHLDWAWTEVAPQLVSALEDVESARGGKGGSHPAQGRTARWASWRFGGHTASGVPYASSRVCRSPVKSGTSIWSNSVTSLTPTVALYGARPSIRIRPARPLVTRMFQWVKRAPKSGPALASPP
jgi:hypothetical protein